MMGVGVCSVHGANVVRFNAVHEGNDAMMQIRGRNSMPKNILHNTRQECSTDVVAPNEGVTQARFGLDGAH